jgi:uncharacterized protein with GYD domain
VAPPPPAEAAGRRGRRGRRTERLGGRRLSADTTQGRSDLVLTLEFPDEAAAFLLEAGGQGDVRTETLRAFTPEEREQVWGKRARR